MSQDDDDDSIDAEELDSTLNTIAKNTVGSGQDRRRSGFIVNQQEVQNDIITKKVVDLDLGKNFLKETMNIVDKDKEEEDDNAKMIADELEAMFAGGKKGATDKHSNLKKWKRMDKGERDEAGPAVPKELNSDI